MGEMQLHPSEESHDNEEMTGLQNIIEKFLPEDKEFLESFAYNDRLGYVYVMLVEKNEDPNALFRTFGVSIKKGKYDEI